MPKCKYHQTKFVAKYFNQKYCLSDSDCIRAFNEYVKSVTVKKERKELGEMKKSLLTHKDYLKMLQVVFNNFIRKRDEKLPCISCGTFKAEEFHAGHYIATTYSYLRFNEFNVWKQCSKCNTHLRGNSIPYRIELIKRIGLKAVEGLENDRHNDLRLSIPQIQEMIQEYKFKLKQLTQ